MMRFSKATAGVLLVATAALAGCEQADTNPGIGMSALSEATLDSLMQEYPRLGAAPLPEPQPSAAADPVANAPDLPGEVLETVTGEATFYADRFEGQRTASGIPFRQNQMVAAHRAYPFGTILRVTNLGNDRSVKVRVVDRGPTGAAQNRGGILDLSRRAATELDYIGAGRAQVQVEVLQWGDGLAT